MHSLLKTLGIRFQWRIVVIGTGCVLLRRHQTPY